MRRVAGRRKSLSRTKKTQASSSLATARAKRKKGARNRGRGLRRCIQSDRWAKKGKMTASAPLSPNWGTVEEQMSLISNCNSLYRAVRVEEDRRKEEQEMQESKMRPAKRIVANEKADPKKERASSTTHFTKEVRCP